MKNHKFANPYYLKPGDTVDIVAPSSKCDPSIFKKIKALLHSWQLQCHIPNDLFGDSLLYANSDDMRFAHLKKALLNRSSKAVWCLLGGFGSTKLVPMLSSLKSPTQAKIFLGFSDITALHIFLQGQWGWPTVHAPSGYQAALNKISNTSINLLKNILFHKDEKLIYDHIVPLNDLAKKNVVINGPLIGGNLHIIQVSLGTSWQINAMNKILFIEDINERAYRIDRALTHLNQVGVIRQSSAILFGDVIDKGEPDGRRLVKKAILEFASQCDVPVLQIGNIGHGPINNPILFGKNANLAMGSQCVLEFNEY